MKSIAELRGDPMFDPFVDDLGFEKRLFHALPKRDGTIYKLWVREPGFDEAMPATIFPISVKANEMVEILAPTGWLVAGMIYEPNGDRVAIPFAEQPLMLVLTLGGSACGNN